MEIPSLIKNVIYKRGGINHAPEASKLAYGMRQMSSQFYMIAKNIALICMIILTY